MVGPSGCGKSTLLRIVAVSRPSLGEVRMRRARRRRHRAVRARHRDRVPDYTLSPHVRVYDDMAYELRNRRLRRTGSMSRVHEAARILEIERLLDRGPRQLLQQAAPARRDGARDRARRRRPCSTNLVDLDPQAARLDARGYQELTRRSAHVDLRRARPARSDDARRHAGGDEHQQGRPDQCTRSRSTKKPPPRSSRPSSAQPR